MKNFELEFKWDANFPRAFFKMHQAAAQLAHLSLPTDVSIFDTYLDHKDERFSCEKIAFRVRCCQHKWEATFKTKTQLVNGKAVRQEETLPLKADSLQKSLALLARRKTWHNLDVTQLHARFSIRNKRRIYRVKIGHTEGELSFDNFAIYVCGRVVKMKEIEFEFKRGSMEEFEKFAHQITEKSGLKFAKISKVKTAESLFNLWK